jgi:hypothetical protein
MIALRNFRGEVGRLYIVESCLSMSEVESSVFPPWSSAAEVTTVGSELWSSDSFFPAAFFVESATTTPDPGTWVAADR